MFFSFSTLTLDRSLIQKRFGIREEKGSNGDFAIIPKDLFGYIKNNRVSF